MQERRSVFRNSENKSNIKKLYVILRNEYHIYDTGFNYPKKMNEKEINVT